MISKRQKMIGAATALFIVLCVSPHSAMGKLGERTAKTAPRSEAARGNAAVTARLVARGNQPVLVNGYGSYTGATVMTGATIQTPDGVRATLQLAKLGSFELSPNTIAVVDFDGADLKGTLKRGCAVLTTYPSVSGKLVTPDGGTMSTDNTVRSSVTACSDEASSNAATSSKSGSPPWVFDLNPGSMIDIVRAGMIFGANGNRNRCCCCCCCRNPSPSSPNDCGCPR